MIFVWIGYLVRLIGYLFIPPAVIIPKRDPNAVCPMCGHRKGKLSRSVNGGKPAVQHDCLVCGCQFFEDPVLKAPTMIQAEEPIKKVA